MKWTLKDMGNLNIVNFRCWKFGVLQFHLLKTTKSCQFAPSFPMFPGKNGDGRGEGHWFCATARKI